MTNQQPKPDYDGQFTRSDAITNICAMHYAMGTTMQVMGTDEEVFKYHDDLSNHYDQYQEHKSNVGSLEALDAGVFI